MALPKNAKITKFREDKRLIITSGVRSLALIMLVATVVFCIFNYQDDLNIANLKRIVSYIDRMTLKGEQADTFPFDSGIKTIYIPFEAGIATCSGGSFRFIPPLSDMDFTAQIKHANPAMTTNKNSVFVYDIGGKVISRFNSYSQLSETTIDSEIISLSVNASGQSAVVTDEAGYRTGLIVLDKYLKEQFRWQTAEHFAFLSALAPNGDTAAVLCVGQQNGTSNFYIRLQPTDGEECRATIELGTMKVYSMQYFSNNKLVILGENGVYIYDKNGEKTGEYAFPVGSLITYSHTYQSECVLSLKGEAGDSSRILIIDEDGGVAFEKVCGGNVRHLDYNGDMLALIASDGVVCFDLSTGESEMAELSGVKDVLITGDGHIAAVYAEYAKLVNFDSEE